MITKFNNVKDERWLKRYLNFISIFNLTKKFTNTHIHHILPSSLYHEYKNLKVHTWNKSILTHRAHLIAHYMLAKALGGNMWFAYNNMNCHNVKLSSRLYEIGSKKVKEIVSLYSKNKVMAKCLITSEIIKVDILEFKKNKNLVGINSGRFIGDNNVAKNKLVREKISNQLSGRIHCIDITNNKRLFLKETDFNDEVHHKIKPFSNNKGFTCVKTENGLMRLSVEEFKNSDYVHFNKGNKLSEETKKKISVSNKGIKKPSVSDKLKKERILYNNYDVEIGRFLGDKELQDFCSKNNISHSRLNKFKNSIVPNNITTQIKNYEKVMNTNGYKLIIV
jgi:hypothetical protein